jgi:Cd2+/Zn2+-exporting ATPase
MTMEFIKAKPGKAPFRNGVMLVDDCDLDDVTMSVPPKQSARKKPMLNVAMDLSNPMFLSSLNKRATPFHPDFVNCGSCVECEQKDEPKEEHVFDDIEVAKNREDIKGILRATFHIENLILPSQIQLIQSVLQPLPGVQRVQVNLQDKLVTVDHDGAAEQDQFLETLKTMGYHAVLQDDAIGDEAIQLVRSQFYVQGICCASECPSINKIIKHFPGVHKIQINITTKMVYVQHCPDKVDVHEIAMALHSQGFDSRVVKDGAASRATRPVSVGRTTLHIDKVMHKSDIDMIQQCLGFLAGVKRVGVNLLESVVYVEHNVAQISARQLSEHLMPQCANRIASDAQDEIAQQATSSSSSPSCSFSLLARSKFVESTLSVANLTMRHSHLLERSFRQNYIPAQLRAFYPNVQSKTIKIEHNASLLKAEMVAAMLQRVGMQATVAVDGAVENLALPLMEDYDAPIYGGMVTDGKSTLHINVILSGIFWFISMLSFVGGDWVYLKYFGLLSVVFGIPPVALKAWRTLRRFQFDANCMMVTAAFGALALQEYDEAASVAFLFAVSEYLEARATYRARKALGAIVSMKPEHAHVLHPVTKEIIITPAEKVPVGSLISVRTGDKIVADGVVVEGSSSVDESSLTGEAVPVLKNPEDAVAGGSINVGDCRLIVRTLSSVDDSAVSRLIRLVEEAQANRSPTEMLVDSFARKYTPFVIVMAAFMCIIPWFISPEIGRYWTLNGLIIIVIACPCALTISTPVTYAAGLAACAQKGVIVKGGASLEALGNVDRIVFDKTGTLTTGQFILSKLETVGDQLTRKEMLEILHLLESPSSHPLSATLVQAARQEGVGIPAHRVMKGHTMLKGEGVTAIVDGKRVYVGNKRLFSRLEMYDSLGVLRKQVEEWSEVGGTVGYVGIEGKGIVGAFCVTDAVRHEARDVVMALLESGIEVMMLTGDGDGAAKSVARQVGLPASAVHSQLLPEDKLHFVGSLIQPASKQCISFTPRSLVMMVGDGINDAPALAVADVGVAMGEGAALAMEMSDITLMDCNLSKLLFSVKMGTRVIVTIQENIFLSLLAKAVVVVLTFAGKMTLLAAIAADVGIMLIVTLNGIKLLPPTQQAPERGMRRRIDLQQPYNSVGANAGHDSDMELV